jgi:flagellar biosynthesis chaperone FliJ
LRDDFRTLADRVRELLLEIDVVKSAAAQQEQVVFAAGAAAGSVREEFLAARAERKALEAVRARAYAAFLAEQDRREAADDDEANARRGIISP